MPVREKSNYTRCLLLALGLLALAAAQAPAQEEDASVARLRKDIFFLASDECEGRGVDTQGINKAADHIVAEFKKAGLKPGGKDGYFQPFTIRRGAPKLEGATLVLKGPQGQTIELEAGKDFTVLGTSAAGKLTDAPLVFAGFGLTSPEAKYDDYKDLDVTGKVVVVVRRTPRFNNGPPAPITTAQASLEHKWTQAQAHKAAAVLLVNDTAEAAKVDQLMPFNNLSFSPNAATIPALQLRRAVADKFLQSGPGTGLQELEENISRELKPHSGPIKGWTVSLETKVKRNVVTAKNIIGVLEGKGPLANETVVVGAHYDHVGLGTYGSRTKNPADRGKKIHYGADDNASGTTSVLELARRFGQMKDREGRRLVFMAFSGEELGLLGSYHYCKKEPLFPLKDTVFMLNLDMVGRLHLDKTINKEVLACEGVKTGEGFDALAKKFNAKYGFDLYLKPGDIPYSDHYPFYEQKVPVLFYCTDYHPDYHRPSDTADKINVVGMKKIVDLSQDVLTHFSTAAERPKWTKLEFKTAAPPTLGVKSNMFANSDGDGVNVLAVRAGGPAEKAGIKARDKIVLLNNREIRTEDNFERVMEGLRAGQTYECVVVRKDGDGKEQRVSLKVTPEAGGWK